MKTSHLALEIGVGLPAGLPATKVPEYAQQALWAAPPGKTRRQVQPVRPRPPFRVAAETIADLAGFDLDERKMQAARTVFHYASGVGWGPVYCLMRRAAGMGSLGAGVAAGMSMSIILDEFVTPALVSSAPNEDCPAAAHVRGLLGPLVSGLAVAGTAEILYRPAEPGRPDQQTFWRMPCHNRNSRTIVRS